MITKELVDRINTLARKQRTEGLTPEEKEEQHQLRQQYLKGIRGQVINALNNIRFAEGEGSCGCGCGQPKHQHQHRPQHGKNGGCGCSGHHHGKKSPLH
ncbi:DUF896 domain-containing protein [Desulforamulus putei]|uniref:UPF0291 protein SAMN02745133_00688 n=1 Tax=Desulforamulus putei DSM 12395 TaxID=1121429 RepID=A0A1M4ULL2_9FIRM|nr:DUF896 domain-containing protein [Desulforamulus putei]SHE57547.1 Uncharacterized protein YnzC, UPF0291/DUF896 family [Desulforamulus putei DSM 12395]